MDKPATKHLLLLKLIVMKIYINQKAVEVADQATLAQVATQLQLPTQGIAIAVDYEVIPRSEWDTYRLKPETDLVVVQAVSGG